MSWWNRQSKLKKYYFLSVTICLIVFVILAAFLRQKAVDRLQDSVKTFSEVTEESMSSSFDKINLALYKITDEFEHLTNEQWKNSGTKKLLQVRDFLGIDHVSFSLIDENGYLVASSTGKISSGANVSERDYFKKLKYGDTDFEITKPVHGALTNKWQIIFARPLMSEHGKFIGVAIASIYEEFFPQFFQRLRLEKNDLFAVSTGEPLSFISRFPQSQQYLGAEFKHSSVFDAVVKKQNSHFQATIPSVNDGIVRNVKVGWVKKYPVLFVVGLSLNRAIEPWLKSVIYQFLFLLVSISLIFFLLDAYEKRSKELHKQLLVSIEASKNASLANLAGGIAHEINNPLAIIDTLTEQAREIIEEDGFEKGEALKRLSAVRKNVVRIGVLVASLVDLAKKEEFSESEGSSVREIIRGVLSLSGESLKAKGVNVMCNPISEELRVIGSSSQLSQVLLNLISNADDAIHSIHTKWIHIEVDEEPSHIAIRVIDSGVGIPKDLQQKIFQPFFTTKKAVQGAGIGLTVSSSILENYGGTLSIDQDCPYTCFVIRLRKLVTAKQKVAA